MAIGVLLLIAVFSLLLNSFLLWLSCRIVGARIPPAQGQMVLAPVSFRRALAVAFGAWLLLTPITLLAAILAGSWVADIPPITVLVLTALGEFVLVLVWLLLTLRLKRGSVFLVALLWYILGGVASAAVVLTVQTTLLEGFVIPTGAMAPTLYGDHKSITCPECGVAFALNASAEDGEQAALIIGCTCPNCRTHLDIGGRQARQYENEKGDRILVGKGLLAKAPADLRRNDLVVFTYPDSPPGQPLLIYVKRLIGLPDETIAVHQGHFYVSPAGNLSYKDMPLPDAPLRKAMHTNDAEALKRFRSGEFEIVRTPPEQLWQCRHRVYDNDHPARDKEKAPPRWSSVPPDAFAAADEHGFQTAAGTETAWLRYRHLLGSNPKPSLITDFSGYNSFELASIAHIHIHSENWVGDLLLEGEVDVLQPKGELILELSRGVDRFRVSFDLATGQRRYTRLTDGKETELFPPTTGTPLAGTCNVRVANAADALTVWVNDVWQVTVPYAAAERAGPTAENDLEPASIGVRGAAVKLQHLTLWRGGYCPVEPGRSDAEDTVDWSDPETWESLRRPPVRTFYVQSDHYFVVGDNAAESSDSRTWGLVPRNLLLGQPFFVYYPVGRAGVRH